MAAEGEAVHDTDLFLQTLLGVGLPEGLWAHLWRLQGEQTDWVRDVDAARTVVTRSGRRDVYFGVGLAPRAGARNERVKAATAAGLFGVVADLDFAGPAHKSAALPTTADEARMTVGELGLSPTILVHSGHGIQAWWLFKEPWRFDDDMARGYAVRLGRKWQEHINRVAAGHDWKFDAVGDLARVLRLPGTVNAKDPNAPVTVRIWELAPDVRYAPDDITQAIFANGGERASSIASGESKEDTIGRRRFTKESPCPICGGSKDDPQGEGRRCWGYRSADGQYIHCTNERYAGELEINEKSQAYPHKAYGLCRCGETHSPDEDNPNPPAGGNHGAGRDRSVTDNADRYRDRYGDVLRYVSMWSRWYVWNTRFWWPDERETPVRLGYELVKSLWKEVARERDDTRRGALAKVAKSLDSKTAITSMIEIARTLPPIATIPSEMDREDWEAVAANGVIELRTGRLLPFRQDKYHTRRLGPTDASIPYDEDARCPEWLEYLDMVLEGRKDDIQLIRRAVGYSLTGDVSEQCWFLLTGLGSNGKSTFSRALKDVMGTYGHEMPVEALLIKYGESIPVDIADLVGVRFAVTGENEEGKTLAESLLKRLTGGDDLRARHLYHDPFTFKPKAKLWVHTNHKPKIRGQDHATWRRIRLIPFNYTIPKADKTFYERVLRPELPGILNWAVQGGLEWQREGTLGESAAVTAATAGYRQESDVIRQYLATNVLRVEGAFTRSSDLYADYSKWCKQQSIRPESNIEFSRRVASLTSIEPSVRKLEGSSVRVFQGLQLEGEWNVT